MTKQIYVISVEGGEYDSVWSRVEFITDDIAKGQAYVDKMNAMREVVADAYKQVHSAQAEWVTKNPIPILRSPVLIDVPKWASSTVVTQEMRNERNRLNALNEKEREIVNQPHQDWCNASWLVNKQFKATFSEEIQKGIEESWDDTYWTIEPIAWLE